MPKNIEIRAMSVGAAALKRSCKLCDARAIIPIATIHYKCYNLDIIIV
ncbi:MAG: hypothetical protein LLF92_10745 [Planctomycetaceae bacterium]|nr:hypothetical protein [Planctomycetaceae bacterium]